MSLVNLSSDPGPRDKPTVQEMQETTWRPCVVQRTFFKWLLVWVTGSAWVICDESHHLPHEVGRIMNPILQKRKLRLEEVRSLQRPLWQCFG